MPPWFEPICSEVEERKDQDEEQDAAVDAGSLEAVVGYEEKNDVGRCQATKEYEGRQPAAEAEHVGAGSYLGETDLPCQMTTDVCCLNGLLGDVSVSRRPEGQKVVVLYYVDIVQYSAAFAIVEKVVSCTVMLVDKQARKVGNACEAAPELANPSPER